MSKIWVHIRWFLIMIPLGLFSIAVTIFGVGFALVIGLIWGFSLFLWLWMAFALLGVPLAMLLEGKKFNPLWFLLDSSRFDSTRKSGYAKDFEQEFKGDKPTWFETWDWLSRRNRIWNFRNLKLFIPKQGKKIVYGVPKGQLYRNGKEVSVF